MISKLVSLIEYIHLSKYISILKFILFQWEQPLAAVMPFSLLIPHAEFSVRDFILDGYV